MDQLPTGKRETPQHDVPNSSTLVVEAEGTHLWEVLSHYLEKVEALDSDPLAVGSGKSSGKPDDGVGPLLSDDDDQFSLCSDEDQEDENSTAAGIGRSATRKRKRESRKNLEVILENLVMKVMARQEEMHKQLIETMERKEKERIIREEAWRQQEIERARRDNELRAQEISCNAALVSFIQNVTCNTVRIPQPLMTHSRHVENDENTPGSCNRRWPEDEVQALITLRTALVQKVRLVGWKLNIWEEISAGMRGMGYNRSAKK